MRISDWSSDVCSSDLAVRHRQVAAHHGGCDVDVACGVEGAGLLLAPEPENYRDHRARSYSADKDRISSSLPAAFFAKAMASFSPGTRPSFRGSVVVEASGTRSRQYRVSATCFRKDRKSTRLTSSH